MNLLFERRAEIAMRSLRGTDQKQVQRALHELQALEPKEVFRHHKIHRFAASLSEPLYVYSGGIRLRLVLKIDGANCRIVDIVDHDRLDRLLQDRGQR